MEESSSRKQGCEQRHRTITSLRHLKIPDQYDHIIECSSAKETKRIQSRSDIVFQYGEKENIQHNYVLVNRLQTVQGRKMLEKSLSKHFVFGQLTNDEQLTTIIVQNFVCCEIGKGKLLIQQGDHADGFFVLQRGLLEVEVGGKVKKQIRPFQSFGQLALLHDCARSASVKAIQNCTLWMITRTVFKSIIQQAFKKHYLKCRKFIEKVPSFDGLTCQQKNSLANICKLKRYANKKIIGKEGQTIKKYYFLQSGQVSLYNDNQRLQTFTEIGQCIGNQILQLEQQRINTIEAGYKCSVYEINKRVLYKMFGKDIQYVMFRNRIYPYILKSPLLSKLSKHLQQNIISTFQIKNIQKGETIVNYGNIKRNMIFFLLSECNQEEEQNSTLYGQQSILEENYQDFYKQDMVAEKPYFLAYTTFDAIQSVLVDQYQNLQHKEIRMKQIIKSNQGLIDEFRSYAQTLTPKDLYHIKKMAEGSSAGVHLVTDKNRKYLYALKCVQRSYVTKYNIQKPIQQEKKALQLSQSPFLVQYGRSFKNQSYISYLTQFVDGMEFFDLIRLMGILSSKDAKFYIANIIFALEYLHKRDIIYRGLKPENLLVNYDGYLKLTDMKTCKTLCNKNIIPKTFTIVGTPHYIAPEVLEAKGYDHSIDLWSLGIVLYQLVCGAVPFGAYTEDPYDIYQAVLQRDLKFPSNMKDSKCKNLIQRLLSSIQQRRLNGSYSTLKSHEFFSDIEWDKLYEKKIQPPYEVNEQKLIGPILSKLNVKKLKTVDEIFKKKNIKSTRISAKINLLPGWDQQ